MKQHEQLHITYGERANSFLLVEYGFAIPENRYDFVRRSNLTLATFYGDLMVISPAVRAKLEEKLDAIAMKDVLQADLKQMGLHRDVLKLLRCFEQAKAEVAGRDTQWHEIEQEVVKQYLSWVKKEQQKYPTLLSADQEFLKYVEKETRQGKFHWMYQFVLTYRIGQKEILSYQVWHCRNVLDKLKACNGNKSDFTESTIDLCRWSNTLTDYFYEDLGCDKVNPPSPSD